MKIRKPAVAGFFYPGSKDDLLETIEWSFKHDLGPGELPKPVETRRTNTIGYVVPHAGYIYSGPIAAHVFYNMGLDEIPSTIVILGTNHTGYGKPVSIYPEGVWETPLGALEVDKELAARVAEESEIADLDIYAHIEEHSVEVQLPFIQYLYNYIYRGSIKILPIVIGIHTPDIATDIARSLLNATREINKKVLILASSDFNHYDPHEITLKKDLDAINKILELDTAGFYETIINENISVCGPGGIMVLIEITKARDGTAVLLKHATSGDISGDKSAVVGYAAIRFYTK